MSELLSMVLRVTVFLLVAALATNLFGGTDYKKYFQYATGLIVIALVLSPILSFLKKDWKLENWIHDKVVTREAEEKEEEMRMLGKMWSQYQQEKGGDNPDGRNKETH